MKSRITLPVVCVHFRWTAERYGCEKHAECVHTGGFAACPDFVGVRRAGAGATPGTAPTVAVEDDEFAEHCPCAKRKVT